MQIFKNLEPSEGSALAIEQGPRTVAPLKGKLLPDKVALDFFRNSKTYNHSFRVLEPYKKDLGPKILLDT